MTISRNFTNELSVYEIAINKIKLFNLVSLAFADTRIITTSFIVFKHCFNSHSLAIYFFNLFSKSFQEMINWREYTIYLELIFDDISIFYTRVNYMFLPSKFCIGEYMVQ